MSVRLALGAAAAPVCLRPDSTELGRPWRLGLAGAAALAAITMVPFFLSQTYANRGIRIGTDDTAVAYTDLRRAADLDPLTSFPLIGEAIVARDAGETKRALDALHEAQERTPDDWQPYFLEAQILEQSDPARARAALARAQELNPHDADVGALAGSLAPAKRGNP